MSQGGTIRKAFDIGRHLSFDAYARRGRCFLVRKGERRRAKSEEHLALVDLCRADFGAVKKNRFITRG